MPAPDGTAADAVVPVADPHAVVPVVDPDAVVLVVDPDAARAGTAVRAARETGARVAGFVGEPGDRAVDEFVADVLR